MPKLCPSCFTNPATEHLTLGVLPCLSCKDRLDNLPSPNQAVEIIPERIKTERQERGDSITQPHIKGEANKKYIDLWGESVMREKGFTQKEIRNAKYVEDGIRTKNSAMHYYKDRT